MEIAKTKATLNNLIEAVIRQEEGKTRVDVYGSLLVLADQLNVIDELIDKKF